MPLIITSEKILSFITGFGILQGFLLMLLTYFHPRGDRSINKFLAYYIGCLSIIMSGPFVFTMLPWHKTFFMEPFTLLVGPLMYLYIRRFKQRITWRIALPHLAAFFLHFIVSYSWVSYLRNLNPGSIEIPTEGFQSPLGITLLVLRYGQLIAYYFLSRKQISINKRQQVDCTIKAEGNWLKLLINGYLLIVLTTIVLMPMMIKYPQHFFLLYSINIAVATPYIYLIAYKGFTQPSIWRSQPVCSTEKKEVKMQVVADAITEVEEFEAETLSPHQLDPRVESMIGQILEMMEVERMYQEPDLTLQHLSDRLQHPAYQVSLAINEGMKKSFYDLVNGYRVEEAKRLLVNPGSRNYTILSVGFEAGFNSKTTFNTVFKKFTMQTPTEYRDHHRVLAETAA